MAYLGLIPGEDSSGPRRRQGATTKAGNSPARRILVEVAWLYRYPARVKPIIAKRQSELSKEITDIAWRALQATDGAQAAAQQGGHRHCP